MGALMTGLWVIAHECGHQSFSPSLWVNDAVGCIIHTTFFVPYWSWKYSHGQHHANSNSMEKDSVFIPRTDLAINFEKHPPRTKLHRLWGIIKMVTIGWWVYLWFNVASTPSPKRGKWISHFNPFCELFKKSQRSGVIASDIALLVWCWVIYRLTSVFGWITLAKYYWMPFLWLNFWLVAITFLQHTDAAVPKYYESKWTWLRGALGTVDRDYGILNILHHHIGDTHVLHHIFSKIPHYHAQEATQALINSGLLSGYYIMDTTPWYVALWRSYTECWYVNHDEEITWFESVGKKKTKLKPNSSCKH
jgi:omega-6 fatty acid desaturase (delta-12 desaturase)